MKKLLFGLPLLLATMQVQAQAMKTITGVRLYEHHSSTINNGSPFGAGANGKKCGFNFMENRYFSSIDSTKPATEWKGNEAQHIDLVEHKGPFGGPGQPPFGFTSGASTIWGSSDIKGNGKTLYMEAPAGFNYDTTTNVATLQKAYKAASASVEVPIATKGKVYIACIRNTNRYIVMKITEVKNKTPQTNIDDVYFDFDYKWGDYVKPVVDPNAVNDVATGMQLAIWPNPVKDNVRISFTVQEPRTTVNVYNNAGQLVATQLHTTTANKTVNATVDMSELPAGAYYVTVTNGAHTATQVLVKE